MFRTAPHPASGSTAEPARPIVNAMSIDVEDWFQVWAFSSRIRPADWDGLECRVEANVERILALLARHDCRATFFTLGWIAERYPHVIRAIVAGGHELASHGYGHQLVKDMTPDAFREDLLRARRVLEDTGGTEVVGYRAPSFSIGAGNLWAHDVLAETGHRYSSSVYPIAHDHYGMPDAPRFAWRPRADLVEIPPTSIRMGGRNYPGSGGGFFRLFPYPMSRWMVDRVNRQDGESAMFYFHPWEIDPAQPRVGDAPLKSRFRHYVNLSRMEAKLDRLLGDFAWDRVDRVFADVLGAR